MNAGFAPFQRQRQAETVAAGADACVAYLSGHPASGWRSSLGPTPIESAISPLVEVPEFWRFHGLRLEKSYVRQRPPLGPDRLPRSIP